MRKQLFVRGFLKKVLIFIPVVLVNAQSASKGKGGQSTGCTVSITPIQPTCPGDQGGFIITHNGGAGPSYSYAWAHQSGSPSGSGTSSSNSVTITVPTSGVYDITMTDDQTSCSAIGQTTINPPPPSITITLVTVINPTCSYSTDGAVGLTVTGGNGPNYTWIPMPSFSTTDGDTAVYINLGIGNYQVVVSDANNCTATYNFTLTKSAVTATVANTSPDQGCAPNICNGQVTFTSSGGNGGPYSYVWPNNQTTGDIVTGLCDGTYQVTARDNMGCTATVNVSIASNPGIASIGVTGKTDPTGCGICNGTVQVTVSGTAPYTLTWASGSTTINSTSHTITGLCTGTQNIQVTDSLGCQSSVPVTLSSPGAPSISFNVTPAICYGSSGVAEVSASGTGPFSYSWSNNAVTQSITAVAGNYSVTVTDQSTNCTVTGNVQIPGPSAPLTVSFNITPTSGCTVSDGEAQAIPSGGWGSSPSSYSYLWNTTPNQTTQTATGLTGGQTYTLTLTDSLGCQIVQTVSVPNPNAPSVSILSLVSVACYGDSNGTIIVTISGGSAPYTYEWSNNVTHTSSSTSDTLSNLPSGSYTLTLTDASGCTTVYGPISIGQPSTKLSTTISGPTSGCTGQSITYSASVSGGTPNYSYTWNIDGIYTGNPVNVSFSLPITTTVYLTVQDNNGCLAYDTLGPITIYATPSITISGITTICSGNSGYLVASGGTSYVWNTGSTNDTLFYSNLTQDSLFSVTVYNNICSATASQIVSVYPDMFITTTDDIKLCPGVLTSLDLIVESNIPASFIWSTGATASGTSDTIQYTVPSNISDTVLVIYVTASSQCGSRKDSISITIHPPVTGINWPDTFKTQYQVGIELRPDTINPFYGYIWSPSQFLNLAYIPNPTSTPDSSITYYVTVTNPATGCIYVDTVIVVVEFLPVFIPDIFSPNGDGKNDVFKILGSYKELLELKIWDRWGELVFDNSRDNKSEWDGSFRGKPCNSGNYVYKVSILNRDGSTLTKYGNLLLVR